MCVYWAEKNSPLYCTYAQLIFSFIYSLFLFFGGGGLKSVFSVQIKRKKAKNKFRMKQGNAKMKKREKIMKGRKREETGERNVDKTEIKKTRLVHCLYLVGKQ